MKKVKKSNIPKGIKVDAPEDSPMGRFHKAMEKIVSVPKSKQKKG